MVIFIQIHMVIEKLLPSKALRLALRTRRLGIEDNPSREVRALRVRSKYTSWPPHEPMRHKPTPSPAFAARVSE